jgi:flagellar motility protein MotE (MotC chaperone)
VPSLAISIWLLFAATPQADPLSPPPHGREVSAPEEPAKPTVPAIKATPSVTKPTDPKSPKSPSPPNPTKPAPIAAQPIKPAKPSLKTKPTPSVTEEPAEEAVAELIAKDKAHRKGPRNVGPLPDRGDVPERKNPWSADRYAAVVPPGLTLSALRSQISKSSSPTADAPNSAADNSKPGSAASDIEKAREALRQETARLETLLKAAGNCGAGIGGMPLGDNTQSAQSIPAALREAPSEQIDSVSKAMKGMKPEQAAAMVARLDRGLAAEILRRMKAIDAGAILGLLKPELAAELATEIAIRKPMYAKDKKGVAK